MSARRFRVRIRNEPGAGVQSTGAVRCQRLDSCSSRCLSRGPLCGALRGHHGWDLVRSSRPRLCLCRRNVQLRVASGADRSRGLLGPMGLLSDRARLPQPAPQHRDPVLRYGPRLQLRRVLWRRGTRVRGRHVAGDVFGMRGQVESVAAQRACAQQAQHPGAREIPVFIQAISCSSSASSRVFFAARNASVCASTVTASFVSRLRPSSW
jgi:hypothetical protein